MYSVCYGDVSPNEVMEPSDPCRYDTLCDNPSCTREHPNGKRSSTWHLSSTRSSRSSSFTEYAHNSGGGGLWESPLSLQRGTILTGTGRSCQINFPLEMGNRDYAGRLLEIVAVKLWPPLRDLLEKSVNSNVGISPSDEILCRDVKNLLEELLGSR